MMSMVPDKDAMAEAVAQTVLGTALGALLLIGYDDEKIDALVRTTVRQFKILHNDPELCAEFVGTMNGIEAQVKVQEVMQQLAEERRRGLG